MVSCGEGPGGPEGRGVESLSKEALAGGSLGAVAYPTGGPTESDPLLKQVVIDEDPALDLPLPAPAANPKKASGIFNCVPCRSKRSDD